MNNETIRYKPAKTTYEMVSYLEENKNVVFNKINKIKAEDILFKYNYINVITPFKHCFAKTDGKNNVIKLNNRHIYENKIEFSNYYDLYVSERKKYPIIYKNISEFEVVFKSIISYEIVNDKIKINNSDDLGKYLEISKIRVSLLKEYTEKRKSHIINNITNIEDSINDYHDIYCLFDRLSLGHLLSLYTSLENELKVRIYLEMKKLELNFNVSNTSQFIDKVFTLVSIRNCIMHNNSLEILIRFYDAKNKSLRTANDREKFIKMISILSKEKQPVNQVV